MIYSMCFITYGSIKYILPWFCFLLHLKAEDISALSPEYPSIQLLTAFKYGLQRFWCKIYRTTSTPQQVSSCPFPWAHPSLETHSQARVCSCHCTRTTLEVTNDLLLLNPKVSSLSWLGLWPAHHKGDRVLHLKTLPWPPGHNNTS